MQSLLESQVEPGGHHQSPVTSLLDIRGVCAPYESCEAHIHTNTQHTYVHTHSTLRSASLIDFQGQLRDPEKLHLELFRYWPPLRTISMGSLYLEHAFNENLYFFDHCILP